MRTRTPGRSPSRSLRLGVLKQNHFEYDQERLLDAVMMGNKALWAALQEKDRLLAGEVTDEVGIRLGELEGPSPRRTATSPRATPRSF